MKSERINFNTNFVLCMCVLCATIAFGVDSCNRAAIKRQELTADRDVGVETVKQNKDNKDETSWKFGWSGCGGS